MDQPSIRFYRVIAEARAPQRADRSAAGTLPTRATRHCEAVTTASAFGWWVFPPMEFSLLWDGDGIFWSWVGSDCWLSLDSVQFPFLADRFDDAAPPEARGAAPPFLTALPESGTLQIWTGLFARTLPEWSLLIRPPANLFMKSGYEAYEGIVETDRWFGPLFTNIKLTRTDVPVTLRVDRPMLQVQAIPRHVYEDAARLSAPLTELADFSIVDWADYSETIVEPSKCPQRLAGRYSVDVRKRRKNPCSPTNK